MFFMGSAIHENIIHMKYLFNLVIVHIIENPGI